MKKPEIIAALRNNHQAFINYLGGLSSEDFVADRNGKWTAGQHLDHIIRSVTPLNKGLVLPGFLLKLVFGKANRPSKTFDELVAKYKQKLSEGGKASAPFIPPPITTAKKESLLRELDSRSERLCRQADRFSEIQLDQLVAPHPLLGKITLREMLYFTAHHVLHHKALVEKTNL
ncbi:MAG: DinB family protein [Chitinophagaceae bacterium]